MKSTRLNPFQVLRDQWAIMSFYGSMSFRVESNAVTGASPARTGWPAGA
jgi:hypothetical protein